MSTAVFPRLREVLAQIDRPGSFCASGSAPVVLPGLEVEGVGPIGLPLTTAQARELKQHCEQAPYGKGGQTLVDTKVRRVLHLTPERFKLTNPEWDSYLQQTLQKVQEELGLEKQKLEAHLYDLLLYEKGSFFLPHRDSEKLDRMVATLVIVLPSKFKGGELIVRHEGQQEWIDFTSDDGPFRTHFAAFYADCEHEIRPLREGHRLCLVYNLTLKKGKKGISAPRSSQYVEKVARLLGEWAKDDSARRLAVTLEHQYTADGLSWDALKGVDRVKAQVLHKAAEQAGCQAYLALLTFHECLEVYDDGGYYGGRRGWRYYDDEDEEEEDTSSDYETGEVIDSDLTAAHWSGPDGKRLPLGEIRIDDSELVDPDALEDVDPEEEFQGFTGNEGSSLDRWYRHAALFIWPNRKRFDVFCDAGSDSAVALLKQLVKQWRSAAKKDASALRADCIDFASSIIARWHSRPYSFRHDERDRANPLLPLLAAIDEPGLIKSYLSVVLPRDFSVEPGKSLLNVCEKYGWAAFQPELTTLFKETTSQSLERNVRLLENLCLAKPRKKAGWSELCASLAQIAFQTLEGIDQSVKQDWQARHVRRTGVLGRLARALLATGQPELLSRLVVHTLARPKLYPLVSTHVSALTTLGPWLKKNVKKHSAPLSDWLAACCEQLEALTAKEPRAPTDFRRPAGVSCKCADCAALKKFLQNPNEEVYRFSAAERRRRHLQDTIRSDRADVNCRTEKRGSPYTLVCTKNTASYEASLKTYHENLEHLATLRSIQKSLRK
jgi:hypothetical protein